MTIPDLLGSVSAYYTGRLVEHGPTPRGVDWNSPESQRTRFQQLLRVCDPSGPFILADYGCGYGALCDYVREARLDCEYRGYDISTAMIVAARAGHVNDARATFSEHESSLAGADYVVASGVFNLKLQTSGDTWESYMLGALDGLAALSVRGFAFNCLSRYSDPERMRPDLFYADPCMLFDRCKRRYSRQVALLHDYGLWEFTIVVRK
jgi:hypothetical protein